MLIYRKCSRSEFETSLVLRAWWAVDAHPVFDSDCFQEVIKNWYWICTENSNDEVTLFVVGLTVAVAAAAAARELCEICRMHCRHMHSHLLRVCHSRLNSFCCCLTACLPLMTSHLQVWPARFCSCLVTNTEWGITGLELMHSFLYMCDVCKADIWNPASVLAYTAVSLQLVI